MKEGVYYYESRYERLLKYFSTCKFELLITIGVYKEAREKEEENIRKVVEEVRDELKENQKRMEENQRKMENKLDSLIELFNQ